MGTPQTEAKKRYNKKTYERVTVYLTPEVKDEAQKHAASKDETLTGLIKRALQELIDRERKDQK